MKNKKYPSNLAAILVLIGYSSLGFNVSAQVSGTSLSPITAGFSSAAGVAVDPIGNVYTVDGGNGALLSIQGGNGSATTLCSGYSGASQVAVDAQRNVYVAGGNSNTVLEYVYTNGSLNFNSPVSIGKGLGQVVGVAVDLSGNVYAVDASSRTVVKIATGGAQVTLAAGTLVNPKQVAVDRLGNVYVADAGANDVVYIPVSGPATTVGSGLNAPQAVATDPANNLYIGDTGNGRILEIPVSNGTPVSSSQSNIALVTSPVSLAIDTRSAVYVAARGSVYRLTVGSLYFGLLPVGTSAVFPVTINFTSPISSTAIKVVTTGIVGLDYTDAGGGTCVANQTYSPGNSCTVNISFKPLAVGPRAGAIVFYDVTNKILATVYLGGGGLGAVLNTDPGVYTAVTPSSVTAPGNVDNPRGAVTDAAGNLFLAETGTSRVIMIPIACVSTAKGCGTDTVVVAKNALTGKAITPNDVSIDGAGNLIIADGSISVWVIPYENGVWNGADVVLLGTNYGGSGRSAVADVAGNIFVADNKGGAVYELPQGVTPGTKGNLIPTGTSAPYGVAVDLFGNLAVADYGGNAIQYVPATGLSPSSVKTGLSNPWGVAFDASGSIWFSSYGAAVTARLPNENGVINSSDMFTLGAANGSAKDFGLWVDASGNIITTITGSGNYGLYGYNNRTVSNLTAVSTALGATSKTALTATISNSGNLSPVYSGTGNAGFGLLSILSDFDDFPLTASTSPACGINSPLLAGYSCNLGFNFVPQSAGTRTAIATIPSSAFLGPTINLNCAPSPASPACSIAGTAPTGTSVITLQLTSPSGTPGPDQPLVITATTSETGAVVPTGSITLTVTNATTGVVEAALAAELSSTGISTFSIPNGLSTGAHSVSATYSGDKNYLSSSATPLVLMVASLSANVSLSSTGTQINPGQAVTLVGSVAKASGTIAPSGTITFSDSFGGANTTLGSVSIVNGVASLTPSAPMAPGTHVLTATYSGDGVYMSGISPKVTILVGAHTATMTSLILAPTVSPGSGYPFSTGLTATAMVTAQSSGSTPNGLVNFSLDGVLTPSALSNGTAQQANMTPDAGTHTLIAYYSGDTSYASSASTKITFTVDRVFTTTTLSTSAISAFAGLPVTLTATVNSTNANAGGTVQFKNGANPLGAPIAVVNGKAALTTTGLPAGSDIVTATYSGDVNDLNSSSSSVAIVISKQATSVSLSANYLVVYSSNPVNLNPTFTAIVNGSTVAPTGTVQFTLTGPVGGSGSSTVTTSSTLGGSAATTYEPQGAVSSTLAPGLYSVTATYSGDGNSTSSATISPSYFYVAPVTGYAGDYAGTAMPNALVISEGHSATMTLTLTPIQQYVGTVQLACSGLPSYTACQIQSNSLLFDGTGTPVSSTITLTALDPVTAATLRSTRMVNGVQLAGLTLGVLVLTGGGYVRRRSLFRQRSLFVLNLVALFVLIHTITACGGHPLLSTPKGTYTMTINASGSGSVNHVIPVQVVIQ